MRPFFFLLCARFAGLPLALLNIRSCQRACVCAAKCNENAIKCSSFSAFAFVLLLALLAAVVGVVCIVSLALPLALCVREEYFGVTAAA